MLRLLCFLFLVNGSLSALTDFEKIDNELQRAGFPPSCKRINFATHYLKNPYVPDDVWESAKPYFLPEDHPIKAKLDKIFKKRVTLNRKTLKKAGFANTKPGKYSKTIVTSHKVLKGYIIKLFTDDVAVDDWIKLKARVKGAREINKVIQNYGFQSWFVVPQKWLYPLPADPSPPEGYQRHHFILVAERMNILSQGANEAKWRSSFITPEKLTAFFIILTETGLQDGIYPFNVPITKDKKIAFIDTELCHHWTIPLVKLKRYISTEMGLFWQKLMDQGGP